jgi:hypothetical protein
MDRPQLPSSLTMTTPRLARVGPTPSARGTRADTTGASSAPPKGNWKTSPKHSANEGGKRIRGSFPNEIQREICINQKGRVEIVKKIDVEELNGARPRRVGWE